jgi:hypothetical protein
LSQTKRRHPEPESQNSKGRAEWHTKRAAAVHVVDEIVIPSDWESSGLTAKSCGRAISSSGREAPESAQAITLGWERITHFSLL